MKYKKVSIILLGSSILLAGAYWFFFKTLRGSSLAVYAVGGWKAPLSIRYACGVDTDKRVVVKFSRPLNFDEPTKDLLKNFWYYSYYRDCLYQHGYDFTGNQVPKSSITQNESNAIFRNPYAWYETKVPNGTRIAKDNALDVDFDDYLLASSLETGEGPVTIQLYTKSNDYKTFSDLNEKMQYIPTTNGKIITKTIGQLADGTPDLRIIQDDGMAGFATIDPTARILIVFGPQSVASDVSAIEQSIRFLPN